MADADESGPRTIADAGIVRHRPRTRIPVPWVEVVNRLSRAREPFHGSVEGSTLRLAVDRVCFSDAPTEADDAAIEFSRSDGSRFSLKLPDRVLDTIARAVDPGLSELPPGPTGALLLELALAPLLDAAEARLGQTVQIASVGPAGAGSADAVTGILGAELGGEVFSIRMVRRTLLQAEALVRSQRRDADAEFMVAKGA